MSPLQQAASTVNDRAARLELEVEALEAAKPWEKLGRVPAMREAAHQLVQAQLAFNVAASAAILQILEALNA